MADPLQNLNLFFANLTELKLQRYFDDSQGDFSLRFAIQMQLFPSRDTVENCNCGRRLSVENNESCKGGFIFRCSDRACRFSVTPSHNTIFENAHLTFSQILIAMFLFTTKKKVTDSCEILILESAASKSTAFDYYKTFRQICSWTIRSEFTPIGGEGLSVEVICKMMHKNKYNQGRASPSKVSALYIIVGICHETGGNFAFCVKGLDRDKLWAILRACVQENSNLFTDTEPEWEQIQEQEGIDFFGNFFNMHETIELTETTRVRNVNGIRVTINHALELFSHISQNITFHNGIEHIQSKIDHYLYRRAHFNDEQTQGERFRHFLSDVARFYTGPFEIGEDRVVQMNFD